APSASSPTAPGSDTRKRPRPTGELTTARAPRRMATRSWSANRSISPNRCALPRTRAAASAKSEDGARHATAGPAYRARHAHRGVAVQHRRVRAGPGRDFRPLSDPAGRGGLRILDLGPDLPARPRLRRLADDQGAQGRRHGETD